MSVRNGLKNLGTVIECAENTDDSSLVSTSTKKVEGEKRGKKKVGVLKLSSDERSLYLNNEECAKQIYFLEKNQNDRSASHYVPFVTDVLSNNADVASSSKDAKAENHSKAAIVVSASDKKRKSSTFTLTSESSHSVQNNKFSSSNKPYNRSRLNFISFLNNIATSTVRPSRRNRTNSEAKLPASGRSLKDGTFKRSETYNDAKKGRKKAKKAGADYTSIEIISAADEIDESSAFIREEPKSLCRDSISADCDFHSANCERIELESDHKQSIIEIEMESSTKEDLTTMAKGISCKRFVADSNNEAIVGTSSSKNTDKLSTNSELTLASVASATSLSFCSGVGGGNGLGSTSNNSIVGLQLNVNSIGNTPIPAMGVPVANVASGGAKQKILECPICCFRKPLSNFPPLINCSHRCCRMCLILYLKVEIMESRTSITCPECSELLHVNDIYTLLEKHTFLIDRYERFSLRRVLSVDPDTRWCPAPDCTYAVIAAGCAACPQLSCERPGCGTSFCYHCKNYWHENQTCDQARDGFIRPFDEIKSDISNEAGPSKLSRSGDRVDRDMMKSCPRCGALIVKMNDGSCNHMTCALCGVEFCWLCLKQINELHYISPTGCTFWGKKPWTRKKKLLWQIGTLIGAPLGIALIAGLAVPGIICGVPIFIGRKTYQRFINLPRARRHLVTAVSVAGSLLVSPVLAVMAVGVGVPIMLAYVYGVVPLSLCRNGGCGSGSTDVTDTSDVAYGEDIDDTNLLASEAQERLRLLQALSIDGARRANQRNKNNKKQRLEVTLSDRSSASSPSAGGGGYGSSSIDTNSAKFRRSSAGGGLSTHVGSGRGGIRKGEKKKSAGGSVKYSQETYANYTDTGSMKVMSYSCTSTGSQRRHRRQQSTESGITSLGEKMNTEDASVKAIAGSQYNYDDRSVWSNGGLQQADLGSYNEDNASTKACGGSVLESRSLAEVVSCTLSHLPASSTTSAAAIARECGNGTSPISPSNVDGSGKDCSGAHSIPLRQPDASSVAPSAKCDYKRNSLSTNTSNEHKKKTSKENLSKKSFDLHCSSTTSTCSNLSSAAALDISSNAEKQGVNPKSTPAYHQQHQKQRISLRKFIRHPINLITGHVSSRGGGSNGGPSTSVKK